MRKRIVIIVFVLVIAFILMPIPNYLKDGGSIEYKSFIYKFTKFNKLNLSDDKDAGKGYALEIFGIEIFNTLKDVNENYEELGDDFSIQIIEQLGCNNEKFKYFEGETRNVYTVCLDEIILKSENKMTPLNDYFNTNKDNLDNAIDKIISKLEFVSSYDDGGSSIYKSDRLTILKCNTISGNKDVYIGSNYFDTDINYCK